MSDPFVELALNGLIKENKIPRSQGKFLLSERWIDWISDSENNEILTQLIFSFYDVILCHFK